MASGMETIEALVLHGAKDLKLVSDAFLFSGRALFAESWLLAYEERSGVGIRARPKGMIRIDMIF